MPYQIIYSSESATPMQSDDLEDILEQARDNNAEQGITGALVYCDGVFLQIIEGEFSTIQDLMSRISRDVRHETVTVLRHAEIQAPAFGKWDMAYVSATPAQVANWAGISESTAVPDVLSSMRKDSAKLTHLATSILSLLNAQTGSRAGTA